MTKGLYAEDDLKGLSSGLVSPAVVALGADDAPNRAIILAGSGAFERAHITMTRGSYIGDVPDAAEQITLRMSEISDRSAEQVPLSGSAQYQHEVNHPARPGP